MADVNGPRAGDLVLDDPLGRGAVALLVERCAEFAYERGRQGLLADPAYKRIGGAPRWDEQDEGVRQKYRDDMGEIVAFLAAQRVPAVGDGRGVELIATERRRQMEAEGWPPEHDDTHTHGELRRAAIAYATYPGSGTEGAWGHAQGEPYSPSPWPFELEAWKPSTSVVADLVKAGALIAAEIDRLYRVERAAGYAATDRPAREA